MKTHQLLNRTIVAAIFLTATFCAYAENNSDWPREIVSGKTVITIYQPDVESLTNNKMESRSAVSVVTKENPTPVFGAVWLNCRISTDMDERTVELIDVNVESAKFPDIEENKVQQYSGLLEREMPKWELTMSLDELLASMEYNENTGSSNDEFNNTPPEIIFATTPTALVLIDGEPSFKKLENSEYENVVNTPFFIVRHQRTGRLYLKGGKFWYSSVDVNDGWSKIMSPPSNLEELAQQAMQKDEESEEDFNNESSNIAPQIIIRTSPAELIQSNGVPEYSSIQGTSLLYMTNTDDDILLDINTQEYYTLISGRWYKTKSPSSNNWTFVAPDQLPEDFSRIPEDSEMANVRSSVYGTTEAKESVLENTIPQTATIDRNEARAEVSYDGDPHFEEISGTSMQYAVNTNSSVLYIQGRYYCCDNGVWFEAMHPMGPWIVATYIPDDVRRIPPQYPVYNVKYVYIYDYTPEVVYVGYTPGYMHCYTYRGCVYYGTGYYYRPWHGHYYYPRPYTYGFRVRYNPYTGWGFTYGVVYGGPYNWIGFGWHEHHYSYWGPIGYRHVHPYHYYHRYNNPNYAYKRGYDHGYADAYRNSHSYSYRSENVYGNRRSTSQNVYQYRNNGVSRSGAYTYNARTGERLTVNRTNTRQARVSTNPNNVYTDRSGNIYRRDDNGNWQERRSGQWQERSRDASDSRQQDMNTRERQTDTRQQDINTRERQTDTRQQDTDVRERQSDTRQQGTDSRETRTQTQTQTRTQDSQDSRQSGTRTNENVNNGNNNSQNLNRQYDSRNRGTQRTQEYQYNRQQNQQKVQQDRSSGQNTQQMQQRSNQQNTQQVEQRSNQQNTQQRSTQQTQQRSTQQNNKQMQQNRNDSRQTEGKTRTNTSGQTRSRETKTNTDNKDNNQQKNTRSTNNSSGRTR